MSAESRVETPIQPESRFEKEIKSGVQTRSAKMEGTGGGRTEGILRAMSAAMVRCGFRYSRVGLLNVEGTGFGDEKWEGRRPSQARTGLKGSRNYESQTIRLV